MNSDLVKAAISFVVLGAIGVILLAGAGTGALQLPTGFGLFDPTNLVTWIILMVVLLVLVFILYRVYVGVRK